MHMPYLTTYNSKNAQNQHINATLRTPLFLAKVPPRNMDKFGKSGAFNGKING